MQLIKDEESKSKEIPMYRKDEIYLGLKETSFEELKAQKWMKLQKLAQNARTPTQHKLNHDKIARNDHIEFNMDESLSDLKVNSVRVVVPARKTSRTIKSCKINQIF